jgi:hypothetical protein
MQLATLMPRTETHVPFNTPNRAPAAVLTILDGMGSNTSEASNNPSTSAVSPPRSVADCTNAVAHLCRDASKRKKGASMTARRVQTRSNQADPEGRSAAESRLGLMITPQIVSIPSASGPGEALIHQNAPLPLPPKCIPPVLYPMIRTQSAHGARRCPFPQDWPEGRILLQWATTMVSMHTRKEVEEWT